MKGRPVSRLDDTIENLYIAFEDVRKPLKIDACPCCWSDTETRLLLNGRLREAPMREIRVFATSALSTVGSVEDYLYFLPRILHLSVTETGEMPDFEITGQAIGLTEPQEWPCKRRQALDEYLVAVVHHSLAPGRQFDLDSWLCAISKMGLDVRPYLHLVEKSTDAVLEYFNLNASGLPERRLTDPFWKLPSAGHDDIVDWFYSPRIRKVLFDAYGFQFPIES